MTVMTHAISLEARQASHDTFEHITPVLTRILPSPRSKPTAVSCAVYSTFLS